jgi:hypothetical protein
MEEKKNGEENSPSKTENEEKEERELRILVAQVTDTNKRLDDDYDERLKRIENSRKMILEDESSEERHLSRIQIAKEKYNELKARISNARRAGKDPIIADFLSRNIPSKIKMAEFTREKKDFDQVDELIAKATQELEDAEKEEKIDVKKEIDIKLKG